MNKTYEVKVSQVARDQMYSHVLFLFNVSEDASSGLKESFVKGLKSLEKYPESFSFYENPALPLERYRKMPIFPYYLVLYEVTNKVVYVDYIIDTRQKNIKF